MITTQYYLLLLDTKQKIHNPRNFFLNGHKSLSAFLSLVEVKQAK